MLKCKNGCNLGFFIKVSPNMVIRVDKNERFVEDLILVDPEEVPTTGTHYCCWCKQAVNQGEPTMQNSVKTIGQFALASILFAPVLAVEDGLRAVGVDVPEKGLAYNKAGQSIMDIWNESAPE